MTHRANTAPKFNTDDLQLQKQNVKITHSNGWQPSQKLQMEIKIVDAGFPNKYLRCTLWKREMWAQIYISD